MTEEKEFKDVECMCKHKKKWKVLQFVPGFKMRSVAFSRVANKRTSKSTSCDETIYELPEILYEEELMMPEFVPRFEMRRSIGDVRV